MYVVKHFGSGGWSALMLGKLCLCVAAFHVVRHIEQKLVRANVAFMITAGLNALMIPFGLAFMITAGLNAVMMLIDTPSINKCLEESLARRRCSCAALTRL